MEPDVVGVFIPIVAIVFGIGVAIVSIITSHLTKVKRHELRSKERIAAMEKGLELPPELENDDYDENRPNPLKTGMILVGVGAGLYFPLKVVVGDGIELFALIPGAIGVAHLLYYFIAGRKDESTGSTRQA